LSNDKTCKLVKIMSGNTWKNLALTAIAATFLVACGDDAPRSGAAPTVKKTTVAAMSGSRSPGKPSAPVSIDYEILGKAIVGLPVAINVQVQGTRDDVGPVAVSYTINDTSALLFQEGQVERLEIASLSEASMQQLAVVPQREGRLFINVSAEVSTPGGSMIKSMAIPIQVGSAPQPSQTGGEVKEGADGELVQSMPAQEN
jgi:hypothetical protein